jgi:hypothetical protein
MVACRASLGLARQGEIPGLTAPGAAAILAETGVVSGQGVSS